MHLYFYVPFQIWNYRKKNFPPKKISISPHLRKKWSSDRRSRSDRRSLYCNTPDCDLDLIVDHFLTKWSWTDRRSEKKWLCNSLARPQRPLEAPGNQDFQFFFKFLVYLFFQKNFYKREAPREGSKTTWDGISKYSCRSGRIFRPRAEL